MTSLSDKVAQFKPRTPAEYIRTLARCIDFGNGHEWSEHSNEAYEAVIALANMFESDGLHAHAQYDNWRGECALDDADFTTIRSLLEETGRLANDEFLYALDVWSGENVSLGDREMAPASLRAIIVPGKDVTEAQTHIKTNNPVPARVETLDLPMGVFIRYFKRLAFTVSWNMGDEVVSLIGRTLDERASASDD